MTEYASKDFFDHLATRVEILEREVEGEKTVTRFILEETRRNSDDLAVVKTRLDASRGRSASAAFAATLRGSSTPGPPVSTVCIETAQRISEIS